MNLISSQVESRLDRNVLLFDGKHEFLEAAFGDPRYGPTGSFRRVIASAARTDPMDVLPSDAQILGQISTKHGGTVHALVGNGRVLLKSSHNGLQALVAAATQEHCDRLSEVISERMPDPPASSDTGLHMVSWGEKRSVSRWRWIAAPSWAEAAPNYPSKVRAQLEALVRCNPQIDDGKLLLWHGPAGTGKTSAIRTLTHEWKSWCRVRYIVDPEMMFAHPAYLTEMITDASGKHVDKWTLLVAEDTDEYLRSSARSTAGASLGRLLNLTDGLLGQGLKLMVLLTTNEEVGRLHPALIRPGRCFSKIDFTEFPHAEAVDWLDATAKLSAGRTPTLAELFALRDGRAGPDEEPMSIGAYA